MGIKNYPIMDIVILASGFVIRVLYGGILTDIKISKRLYLVIVTGSLFMGLGKRRGELIKKSSIQKLFRICIEFNAGFLLLIVYIYGPMGANKITYMSWTPIAQYVMDNFPSFYNPLHSTFNSRTNHVDGGYFYETPILYTTNEGYVRKILASSNLYT